MTQDFLRRVDGYNFPFVSYDVSSLARSAVLSCAAPVGPGRIERGYIRVSDLTPTLLTNIITITIDGVVVYTNTLSRWLGIIDLAVNPIGPWSSAFPSTVYTMLHWEINFDYETSAVISIENTTSADPSTFVIGFIGRSGL